MIWLLVALGAYAALALTVRTLGPWSEHLGLYWALHAAAWIAACAAARTRVRARTVLIAAVVFRLLLVGTQPSLSDDIYRYVWEGRAQGWGFDPYRVAPDAAVLGPYRDAVWEHINHRHLAAIYPPWAQLAFRALALCGGVLAFKLAFCAFDIAVVWLVLRALRARALPAARATLYAWNPLAVVEVAGSGHFEPLGLLPWMAVFVLAERRPLLAWIAFAASAGTRYAPLVAWPAFARRVPPTPARVVAAVLVLGAGFACFATAGTHLFDSLRVYSTTWRGNDFVFGGVQAILRDLEWTRIVTLACVVGVIAVTMHRRLSLAGAALLALGGAIACAPVVHPWYLLWPLVLVPLAPSAALVAWSLTAPLAYHVLYPAFGNAPVQSGNWGWQGIEMAPVALGAAWDVRRWRQARTREAAPQALPSNDLEPASPLRTALVMPVLDEEASLPGVFADLAPWRRDVTSHTDDALLDTIVVVDNGSCDGSATIARDHGAIVLQEPARGYGAACWRALLYLRTARPQPDVVVFMDADRSDDAGDLAAILAPIVAGRADLVIGSRTRGRHERGALLPQARFGNWLATGWIRMWYGFRYTDLGPFRAVRFAALEQLGMRDRDWGWTLEMQIRALHERLRVVEVPVRYRKRVGRSKISGTLFGSARAGRKILWTMWRLRQRPERRRAAEGG